MSTNTNIIAIGTSRGVIIPTQVLKKLNLSLRSPVLVEIEKDSIVIKPAVLNTIRAGWEQAAMLASKEPDELTEFDAMNEENDEWWTWE
jgi:antitoxin MazE